MSIDKLNGSVVGFVEMFDKETGECILSKSNSIHYGNMAYIVAQALTNQSDAYIHYMAFGNGGTSVDTTGAVVYKTPRVIESYESGANLYSRTYAKSISENKPTDRIEVITGPSYTDLKCICTLGYSEPDTQSIFDSSTTNEGDYIFDELALFTHPSEPNNINTSTMLSHVIFHPVQKSQNRIIEVIYTVRVQLS